ncbi:MAG: hypothetical protein AB7H97_18140, partial [Pseudobdellovibrionaceae bacterium]
SPRALFSSDFTIYSTDLREHHLNILSFRCRPLIISCAVIFCWCSFYVAFGRITPREVTEFYHLRFYEILNVIDGFKPSDKSTVMFFGASDIALNVSPRQLEALNKSIDVYNFGVMMGGPDIVRELTSRLRTTLAARQKKIKLAVLRWTPMMYTKRYRSIVRHMQYSLFTYKFPLSYLIANSPSQNLDYFSEVAYLRLMNGAGGQGALQSRTRWFLNRYMLYTPGTDKIAHYVKLWEPEALSQNGNFWNNEYSGEIDFFDGGDNDRGTFVNEHANDLYSAGFLIHRFLFGHLSFDFDPSFFRDFDRAIDDLRQVADQVAVLYIPDLILPNYPQVTLDGRARLAQMIETLRRDHRFHFWDFSNLWQPSSADFIDLTHMSKQGKIQFNKLLATKIEELTH